MADQGGGTEQDCLARAAECELKARDARDAESRREFTVLAAQWRSLAQAHRDAQLTDAFLDGSAKPPA